MAGDMAVKVPALVLLLCFLLQWLQGIWSASDRIAAASHWPAASYAVGDSRFAPSSRPDVLYC